MREFGSSSTSLAGSLLTAHPGLLDPNFRKTVIFLAAHDAEEGSFGMILNRPAERLVGEVLPDQELGALAGVPVLFGGPVGSDQLIFASFAWNAQTQRVDYRHHLGIDEAREAMQAEHTMVRAFIGYAGWSKGQLESELSQQSWLVGGAGRDLIDPVRLPNLWRESLRGFGPAFQLAAEAPDDLSRN